FHPYRDLPPFPTRRSSDLAGFQPLQVGRNLGLEVSAMRCLAGDAAGHARAREEPLAKRVDRQKISAHSFAHDLPVNVHHVAMARSEEHTSELQSRFDLVCR